MAWPLTRPSRRELLLFGLAALLVVPFVWQAKRAELSGALALAQPPAVIAWYREQAAPFFRAYLRPDGSVVDPENGFITHSEAQAYALEIAYFAEDAARFEAIWRFTRTTLLRRDGLFSWRYDPARGVTDRNNATDADLLIAATLALAAERWQRDDYRTAAEATARAIGRRLIVEHAGRTLLLPGVEGFGPNQPDGPILNLSYYDYGALEVVAQLAPAFPWRAVQRDGIALTVNAILAGTLADWNSVADPERPRFAARLDNERGYNAVRVPLNLAALDGIEDTAAFQRMQTEILGASGSGFVRADRAGRVLGTLADPGYRIISALAECLVRRAPMPATHFTVRPTTYYATALHLRTLAETYARHAMCVPLVS